jgi:hypothetical protein
LRDRAAKLAVGEHAALVQGMEAKTVDQQRRGILFEGRQRLRPALYVV